MFLLFLAISKKTKHVKVACCDLHSTVSQ